MNGRSFTEQGESRLDLARIENVKQRGKKHTARCPACAEEGRDKSGDHLVIQPDGRFGCAVHGGIEGHAHRRRIYELAGQASGTERMRPVVTSNGKRTRAFSTVDDAVHAEEAKIGRPCVQRWAYQHADGKAAFVICRFNCSDGKKTFRPIRKDADGWRIEGLAPGTRPLYQLPKLLAADATTPIFVAEGEKCADALASQGLVATTSSHGAKAADGSVWTPLAGRNIALLPDADEAGAVYAREVSQILASLNPPATVRILALPGIEKFGPGADVADWVIGRDPAEARDTLLHLAESSTLLDANEIRPALGMEIASAADWLLEPAPPQPDFILGNVFERLDKVMIVGPTKSRKSFFALQMALCLTAGVPFLGLKVPRPVRVLYIDLENRKAWLKRRLRRMVESMDLTAERVRNLMFVPARRNRDIDSASILTESVRHRPDVLILDPIYKLDAADENDQTSRKLLVAMLGDIAEKADCAIVLVHHDPKGDTNLRDVRDRGSGSSVLNRDVDGTLALTVRKEKNQKRVECLTILSRNAPPEGDRTLHFLPEGYFVAAQQEPAPAQGSVSEPNPDGTGRTGEDGRCSIQKREWIRKATGLLMAPEPITSYCKRLSQELKISKKAARKLAEGVGRSPGFACVTVHAFPRSRLIGPAQAVAAAVKARERKDGPKKG
jgi:putative DNA primase/helicase